MAAIGTGGTLTGVARALRREFPELVVVGNTPGEMPYGTEGPPNGLTKFAYSGGLGHGVRQPFVAGLAADADHRSVEYGAALDAMVRFEARTGLRIGTSAAANWQVAWETAAALGPDDLVVTVFPDSRRRRGVGAGVCPGGVLSGCSPGRSRPPARTWA